MHTSHNALLSLDASGQLTNAAESCRHQIPILTAITKTSCHTHLPLASLDQPDDGSGEPPSNGATCEAPKEGNPAIVPLRAAPACISQAGSAVGSAGGEPAWGQTMLHIMQHARNAGRHANVRHATEAGTLACMQQVTKLAFNGMHACRQAGILTCRRWAAAGRQCVGRGRALGSWQGL